MEVKSEREIDDLLGKYEELVTSLKTKFPRTDLKLLFQLMSHEFLYPEHVPTLQIEIFYKPRVDLKEKSNLLSNRIDRVPSVYTSEKRLVIEPRLQLQDIKELVQDNDIESFAGDVICCTDILLSRRKSLV